jgi:tRNA pseudouridine13 synthase
VTTQLVSVFGVEPEAVLAVRNKDMEILGAWKASKKVELGELVGNRFQLRVDGGKDDEKAVKQIEKELNGVFPNYFGEQRFGSTRKNTARIGELLIRGALEEAAMAYLTDTEGEENKEATAARKELAESRDFAAALKTFPNYLRLERSMIAHLAAQPSDYRGALRTLPRNILMLFVHALQSEIFNEMVSARVKANDFKLQEGEYYCGKNSFDFPDITKRGTKASPFLAAKIVGYETIELNEHEFDLLEKKELKPSDFRVKELPEIGSKGTHRVMLAPYKDFAYQKSVFSFSIPAGAYATVLMREFLDEKQK